MKVLLANPPQRGVYGTPMPPLYPPLGLMYVAASLERAGHVVRLLDMDAENVDDRGFAAITHEWQPELVGITAVTPTYPAAARLGRLAARMGTTVVMGGPHVTALPSEVLTEGAADIVVIGEGERTAVELAAVLEAGADLRDVAGIAWRNGSGVRRTRNRPEASDTA